MDENGYRSEDESDYFADDTLILEYQTQTASGQSEPPHVGHAASSSGSPAAPSFPPSLIRSPLPLRKRTASDSSITTVEPETPPAKRPRIQADSGEEGPILIAHSERVVHLFDRYKIKWGVQFEIARLISTGRMKVEDITTDKLEQLRETNTVSGPCVEQIFAGAKQQASAVDHALEREMSAILPWEELDREEAALADGENEGIGNNSKRPGWYGGKIEFYAQIQHRNGDYKIILERPNLGASSRFTRKFGSWSFLRVRVPGSIFFGKDDLIPFFLRPFVIWGRVFRVCDSKRGSVFLYWTDETFQSGLLRSSTCERRRKSLEELITWHNPLEENCRQLMTKWAARMALGLSNSVPGPRLLPENILTEEDVEREGSDMTDGCGLSSPAVHLAIAKMLSLNAVPTAFQFRLGGCKGMLLMHDSGIYAGNELRAGLRPSQTKIKYSEGQMDAAQLTFDILRTSHMRTPAQLSSEVIINLAENGVPSAVFKNLLVEGIRQLVDSLMEWDGPDAMLNLWIQVERLGGVLSARRARELIGEARVRGYTNKSPDEIELEAGEDGDEEDEDGFQLPSRRSTAWWTDYTSGCPSSLEETVMVLLDAGFTPQSCQMLRSKLGKIVRSKIQNRMQKLRIDLEQSCIAFAVPDPFGVLGPDEIQVKSSKRNLRTNDGLLTDVITGDVLITRNPCKLPTDVRKVRAVEHPQLHHLVDVIVFSIEGLRRLIDFLAGGDYDGDKVLCIWAAILVTYFRNSDQKYATEPLGLESAFERHTETVSAFLSRSAELDRQTRVKTLQTYLLGPLSDPAQIGKYSNMHLNASYTLGYSHPKTVKLAYKFCKVLDGLKSGWKIKADSFKADQAMYSHPSPEWMVNHKKKRTNDSFNFSKPIVDSSNMGFAKRKLKPPYITRNFIMDSLGRSAKDEERSLLSKIKQPFSKQKDPVLDLDLAKPWDNFVEWVTKGPPTQVEQRKAELDKIKEHVHAIYEEHTRKVGVGPDFTSRPIEERQDVLRGLSKCFASGPKLEDLNTILFDETQLARLRASYAYVYDYKRNGNNRFPFNVAMRELCAIKASAGGQHKVVQTNFYERFKLMDRR